MLLYWLCVSLRVICGPVARVAFAETGAVGQPAQVSRPGVQKLLFVASLADALAAGVGDPVGRLLEE